MGCVSRESVCLQLDSMLPAFSLDLMGKAGPGLYVACYAGATKEGNSPEDTATPNAKAEAKGERGAGPRQRVLQTPPPPPTLPPPQPHAERKVATRPEHRDPA